MAAATVGTINAESVLAGGLSSASILVIPIAASNTNTHQLSPAINPTRVAWEGTTAGDWTVATLTASTGVVTFNTDAGTDPHEGNLIVFYG